MRTRRHGVAHPDIVPSGKPQVFAGLQNNDVREAFPVGGEEGFPAARRGRQDRATRRNLRDIRLAPQGLVNRIPWDSQAPAR